MKLEETKSFPKNKEEWEEAWRKLLEEVEALEEVEVVEII